MERNDMKLGTVMKVFLESVAIIGFMIYGSATAADESLGNLLEKSMASVDSKKCKDCLVLLSGRSILTVDEKIGNLLEKPKAYVGSTKCKDCHLQQYYSWRTTMHSRMSQDVRNNKDAIIVKNR
jgi:hypothetical protein